MATRALAGALGLAAVAAGCSHGGPLASKANADGTSTTAAAAGSSPGNVAAPPATLPGATPAPTPAPKPRPAPAPALAGTRVSFAGTAFTLPTGWKIYAQGKAGWDSYGASDAYTEHDYQHMCIGPATTPPLKMDDFCGLTIMAGDVPGNEHTKAWDDNAVWPWSSPWDVTPCPSGPVNSVGSNNYMSGPGNVMTPSASGFKPVGSHTAIYREWKVGCTGSAFTFTARSWHLPKSKIVFFDTLGQAKTPAILASVQFGS